MPTRDKQRGAGRTKEEKAAHIPAGRSCFLGIGIDEYVHFGKLQNAVRDMEAVRSLLTEEYDVDADACRVLRNKDATRKNILRTLRDLPKWVGKDDKLVIYYSGHGHIDQYKKGFWVPADSQRGEEEDYVSNIELRGIIADLPFRHILLISDACFSGTLFVRGADRADAASDELELRTSRWALCSGRADQVVADGEPGQHSPFAASILAELRHNTQDTLRIATLADRVIELTRANYDQLPEGNPLQGVGHQGGQYVFRRRGSDLGIWVDAALEDTIDAYNYYLKTFPNGKNAADAKIAIRELAHADELKEETAEAIADLNAGAIKKAKRLLDGIEKDIARNLTRPDLQASLQSEVAKYLDFCKHYTTYRPIFERILGTDQTAALATTQAETHRHEATIAKLKTELAQLQTALAAAQTTAATTEKQLRAEIAKLKTDLAAAQNELEALKAKYEAPKPVPPKDGLVFIKGGTFEMGDMLGDKEYYDETVHRVTLNDFYLGQYAVTFAEYDRYCEATGRDKPSDNGWGRGNRPVINVSWYDVVAYCNWLSEQHRLTPYYTIDKTSQDPSNTNDKDELKWIVTPNRNANGYRLPTEAEWEYAAREGGMEIRFGNGKGTIDPKHINFDASESYKKPYSVVGEYRQKTVPVGSLNCPNALGLHDMSGNVWEWCWDWYGDYPTTAQNNPQGADTGTYRVRRGGSWTFNSQFCRTALRDEYTPTVRNTGLGFRLARS